MCCYNDGPTLKEMKSRKGSFTAYKIVNYYGCSIITRFKYKSGMNSLRKRPKSYRPWRPNGFHFYLRKKDAYINCNRHTGTDYVVPICVEYKDLIAVEIGGNSYRQGVAWRIKINSEQWKRLGVNMNLDNLKFALVIHKKFLTFIRSYGIL